MKYLLLLMAFAVLTCQGCKKTKLSSPPTKQATLSINKLMGNPPDQDGWAHVFGGKAALEFKPASSDSVLTTIKDTVDLNDIKGYTIKLTATTYSIFLATQSTNTADKFIRFHAEKKNTVVDKDQALSFDAITTDGVITVNKSFTSAAPSFKLTETSAATSFGASGNFYFLYVNNGTSGRVEFTEPASGEKFYKTLTVVQNNRYNITAAPDNRAASRHSINILQTTF